MRKLQAFFLALMAIPMILASYVAAPAKADGGTGQTCMVNFNGSTYAVECLAVGGGFYVSTRGDFKYIYCQRPGSPIAYKCVYSAYWPGTRIF